MPDQPLSPARSTPQTATKKAQLEIVRPKPEGGAATPIPLCFNPTEYQVQKQNTFQEVAIPGLTAPPIQFIRGGSEKLTFDAVVDTSDTMTSVKQAYVDRLRKLLDIDLRIHAPPVVKFSWEEYSFTGVIESLNITYTLFSEAGVPVRAKLSFSLKQYAIEEQKQAVARAQSVDVEKSYLVRRGDTLSGIAERSYGDPAPWRAIARANAISDPRVLEPGLLLTIPRLEATP
jgi:LysM repeat protein